VRKSGSTEVWIATFVIREKRKRKEKGEKEK